MIFSAAPNHKPFPEQLPFDAQRDCIIYILSVHARLSLTSPEQYYQVCRVSPTQVCSPLIDFQVFLSDGLSLGITLSLTFVPSMGLISQYLQRHNDTVRY
jgi:hypothetical protein